MFLAALLLGAPLLGGCESVALPKPPSTVSAEELREKLDRGLPTLVVFACKGEYYAKGHIPGSIPIEGLTAKVSSLPKDTEIVLYCACPGDRAAHEEAALLRANGFTQVRILPGGIYTWIHAGYGLEGARSTEPGPVIGR